MGMFYRFPSSKNGGFLFGVNPAAKVDRNTYRVYVSFINAITVVLKDFGICIKNNGYAYIIDAVMLIIDQNRLDIRLGSDIYPFIRIKYDLSSDAIVEHAIRNAIKSAYSRRHKDEGASRMLNYNKKPTNKQFLLTVTHEVCRKMCSDLNIYPV